jgi:hypothetical protein
MPSDVRRQPSGFPPPKRFWAGGHGVEPLFLAQAHTRMDTGFVPAPVRPSDIRLVLGWQPLRAAIIRSNDLHPLTFCNGWRGR